ncbi:LysE family translocator [Janthinobacterium violaceinigrum]|uniref:LysE family translocator n=1 Tax=Janthinobacterium violaceinigrum TaxID=2654252 RepID=A0A6I1IEL6_9BURK|nr:LysE family transporter [Janthinobacterium violaceinigrum]KAB8066756.1 LysE family translocator [Janthinobacterium violaceinigrum]
MIELLAVALITLLASIVPGPDFAMVTRNSYLHGRRAGLLAALGIAMGVQVHVFYTMFGIGLIIANSPLLFTAIKFAGAVYLVVIGWKTFANRNTVVLDLQGGAAVPRHTVFLSGFLTNALNPKTTLFVISTFTQVVQPGTPLTVQFGYGLCMSAIHLLWFALVALLFSKAAFRSRMIRRQRTIDRLIGAMLIALGVLLACANMDKL